MIIAAFILTFVLSVSAWKDTPYLSAQKVPCVTKTQHLTVTNTWGKLSLATITSTAIEHDHTVLLVTNTIVIPYTTVSTQTITHLMQVQAVTVVSTVKQTKFSPVIETTTHTVLSTWSTQIQATETQVEVMTLTQTVIKPYTTILTTERLVKTYVPRHLPAVTTVTQWEKSTTQEPLYVTWNNFRTNTVFDTVFVTKKHSGHVATTITAYKTVTKCPEYKTLY